MSKRRRKNKGFFSEIQNLLELVVVRSSIFLINMFGERGAAAFGQAAASAFFKAGVGLSTVRENLICAFGREMAAEKREELARSTYRQWGLTLAEWARTWRPGKSGIEGILDRVEILGDHPVLDALAQGRGVIFITAHFGHFELIPQCWSRCHGPLNFIVRPPDNPLLDQSLNQLRSRYGSRVLARRGVIRNAIRCLRAGEILGIVMDQNMIHREGIFVNFFGRPACTTPLPAMLAQRTGAAVFPCFIHRNEAYRHQLIFGEEIPAIRTGDVQADLVANTRRYNLVIEGAIRQNPDHWLWMHRRWRTQPIEVSSPKSLDLGESSNATAKGLPPSETNTP